MLKFETLIQSLSLRASYEDMTAFSFDIQKYCPTTKARMGKIKTGHGEMATPVFMPVGTVGSVKAVPQQQLTTEINAPVILGNTYHLFLRPGMDILKAAGGLHAFINWQRPLLTDSGGYQVFSLATNRKIKEEGVWFQSHIDGSRHLFTPESVMDIQRSIGADIIMAFDECTPYPSTYEDTLKSMELTHRWLDRCITRFESTESMYGHAQELFPIVQGGMFRDLRKISCDYIASKNAAGNAIGGLSVGEPEEMMYEFTALCCENLPAEKPRYLMGVGNPWNLLECISLGIDMFDCVMPTRNGRNGMLFTTQGVINIHNKKWEKDFTPLDARLSEGFSTFYSKAYLHHLFKAKELLALQIASIQNLVFYQWLMREVRKQIEENNFHSWKNGILPVIKKRL